MGKTNKAFFILVFAFLTLAAGRAVSEIPRQKPQRAPLNPEYLSPPSGENFGLLPSPVDLRHLGAEARVMAALPSFWDWRLNDGVTPPKNQSTCGSCWAFAAAGALESAVLVQSGKVFDLSEENIKECNYWDLGCGGGHAFAATSYFTTAGSVLENCDPYHPYDTGICNTACAKIKQVTGWRLLPNDVATIKAAVYQHGGCYTTMYASFPGFSTYDGSYCLYYTGSQAPNHAVLIVGWDDSMTHDGGAGAWICKNSWGTSWGDDGFFYIAYGSARIGGNACYYSDYKQYDYLEMMGTLYYYDEAGWYTSFGYGNNTAWGLVRFTPTKDDCLQAVDFWATDDNVTYDIYIYDNFDGTTTSGLKLSQSGTCPEAGYYSVPLTAPVWVTKGNDFVVVIRFVCTGYNYPVPADGFAPTETGLCYLSYDGTAGSWEELGSYGYDVAIRARGKNHQYVFDSHNFDGTGGSDIAVWRPGSGQWFFYGGASQSWGDEGDIPTGGDYDGNGTTDVAVWRPADGVWYVSGIGDTQWGAKGDIPVPGDYDGDTTTDKAVWRPSEGHWYISGVGSSQWGQAGDIPVPGDYDGDGTTELAVWRPSDGVWYVSGGAFTQWGSLGDIPVPGDYDDDGQTDLAVFRPASGMWYILYSKGGSISFQWGQNGDIPTPGDFNGDLIDEIAVWRPSIGMWFLAGDGSYSWGQYGDTPLVR